MPLYHNLTGRYFGRWSVIERLPSTKGITWWKCRCECGTERAVNSRNLREGTSQSCGCLARELTSKRHYKDLTGQIIGRLVVIKAVGINAHREVAWLCECECGNTTTVSGGHLRNGHTGSCGCYAAEKSLENLLKARQRELLPEDEAAKRRLVDKYRCNAKRRGLEFSLNIDQLDKLFKGKCVYCGIVPYKLGKSTRTYFPQKDYVFNGIDRVDSSKGYTEDNCVSCCETCNRAKRVLSVKDFLLWIERVYIYSKPYINMIHGTEDK